MTDQLTPWHCFRQSLACRTYTKHVHSGTGCLYGRHTSPDSTGKNSCLLQKSFNIQFDYYPQYPRTGPKQSAFGVCGPTKRVSTASLPVMDCNSMLRSQETISYIQKGIPDLREIEPDRIDFYICNGPFPWVNVLDEAWEAIKEEAPNSCYIVVQDGPGDQEKREFTMSQPRIVHSTHLISGHHGQVLISRTTTEPSPYDQLQRSSGRHRCCPVSHTQATVPPVMWTIRPQHIPVYRYAPSRA